MFLDTECDIQDSRKEPVNQTGHADSEETEEPEEIKPDEVEMELDEPTPSASDTSDDEQNLFQDSDDIFNDFEVGS